MNKKTVGTNTYVVYHLGKDETDPLPYYFKSQSWTDNCTTCLDYAFMTNNVLDAEDTANKLNEQARQHGHCLAGHIKFGRVLVEEIKRADD